MRQPIIIIEGTDGAGKHTQQQLLASALSDVGLDIYTKSFPNYDSPSSAPVKMYLAGEFGDRADCLNAQQASALYAVDRLCTYKKELEPAMQSGKALVLDRYTVSNLIHQCSKLETWKDKQEFIQWEEAFEYETLGLPRPDLIFFIEMPIEKSLELARARADYKTGEQKDIHEEDTSYMKKSYDNGLMLAKKLGWTLIHCVDENNNLRSIEEIHQEIMEKTLTFLENYNAKAENSLSL